MRLVLVLCAWIVISGCQLDKGVDPSQQTTILIGIDGMRWDYPDLFDAAAFRYIAKAGVRAEALVPIFPTKTFPNFYALATGLYANKSGILNNSMFDPVGNRTFSMGDNESVRDSRWWGGEPIWVTAEKQGHRSAVFFWPGSETEIDGYRPSYWKSYEGSIPGNERIEQVLEWLELPSSSRPNLVMVYFSDLDQAGHRFGATSTEIGSASKRVNGWVQELIEGLQTRKMYDQTNIIIVSDHGLTDRSAERVVFIDDYIDLRDLRFQSLGQFVTLWPQPEAVGSVYLALRDAHPALKVYRRDDLPERYHLSGHVRTPTIVAVPDLGWTVTTREREGGNFSGGAHGYDNKEPDMYGVFAASGPAFRKGVHINSIQAVDVYHLVARSLELDPAPNDGDPSIIPTLMY